MRQSGKWQSQVYFLGKSRYIGVYATMAEASRAYEIARDRLQTVTMAMGDNADCDNGNSLDEIAEVRRLVKKELLKMKKR